MTITHGLRIRNRIALFAAIGVTVFRSVACQPILDPSLLEAVETLPETTGTTQDASEETPDLGVEPAKATVNTRSLRVREAPNEDSEMVAGIKQGTTYPVLGISSDGAWIQLEVPETPDGSGWVASSFVTLEGDITNITTVEVIAGSAVSQEDATEETAMEGEAAAEAEDATEETAMEGETATEAEDATEETAMEGETAAEAENSTGETVMEGETAAEAEDSTGETAMEGEAAAEAEATTEETAMEGETAAEAEATTEETAMEGEAAAEAEATTEETAMEGEAAAEAEATTEETAMEGEAAAEAEDSTDETAMEGETATEAEDSTDETVMEDNTEAEVTLEPPAAGFVIINSSDLPLRVRSAPTTEEDKIGNVFHEEVYELLEISEDGQWVRINVPELDPENGGWVFAEYVVLGK